MIRNIAAHHRSSGDRAVRPDGRAGQDHRVGGDPCAGADANGLSLQHLLTDRQPWIGVGVVVIGEIHVRGDGDIVFEHDRVPGHEPAVLADRGAITDLDHWFVIGGIHLGGHSHCQGDTSADEAVAADVDGVRVGAVAGWEGLIAALAHRAVLAGERMLPVDRPMSPDPVPCPVDERGGPPMDRRVELAGS